MGYVNTQIIVGRLGREPVLANEEGTLVARFPVGTSMLYRKGGDTIRETEWHQVAVYGEQARTVVKALQKGGEVYVKGPKRTVSYSTATNVPRVRSEIRAEHIQWPGMGQPGAKNANKLPENIIIGEAPDGYDQNTAEIQTGLRIENLGPGLITASGGVARSNAPGIERDTRKNSPASQGGMQLSDLDDEDDFISGFISAPVDELAELDDLSARIGTGQDTFWGRQRAGGTNLHSETIFPDEFQETT